MTVWVLFVLTSFVSSNGGGSGTFQQEFKTLDECRKGATIIDNTFNSTATTVKTLCMGVRK